MQYYCDRTPRTGNDEGFLDNNMSSTIDTEIRYNKTLSPSLFYSNVVYDDNDNTTDGKLIKSMIS